MPTLGYHDHEVVDGGKGLPRNALHGHPKAWISVGLLLTPADVQDNQAMIDPLDPVRFRVCTPPATAPQAHAGHAGDT